MLDTIILRRVRSETIISDYGNEYTSAAILIGADDARGTTSHLANPRKSSCDKCLCDELSNETIFRFQPHAIAVLQVWRATTIRKPGCTRSSAGWCPRLAPRHLPVKSAGVLRWSVSWRASCRDRQ